VNSSGEQLNGTSRNPAISEDGRFIAFESDATNVDSNHSNDTWDVFVRDRTSGTTRRVSIRSDGGDADQMSFNPALYVHTDTSDAQVAFVSFASDLVGAENGYSLSQIYLWVPAAAATPTPSPTPTPTRTPVPAPIGGDKSNKEIKQIVKDDINPVVVSDTPLVSTQKRKATASFTQFVIVDDEAASQISGLLKMVKLKGLANKNVKIRYRVLLKGKGSRKDYRKKATTKRNSITFRKLKQGKYKVKYKVEVVKRKKVVAKTGYSSGSTFTISK